MGPSACGNFGHLALERSALNLALGGVAYSYGPCRCKHLLKFKDELVGLLF